MRLHRVLIAAILPLVLAVAARGQSPARPLDPIIVNGTTTEDYPAVGVLLQPNGAGGHSTLCTAILIGCDTVLTAAHCICGEDNPVAQCLATNLPEMRRAQLSFVLQNAGPFALKSIAIDPLYDFSAFQGDLAIIRLIAPVTGIPPAHINMEGEVPTGTASTIVGFGGTGLTFYDDGVKRTGTVTTSPCIDPRDGTLKDRLLCWNFGGPTGPPGSNSSTCEGDSGGPLFANTRLGLRLAGIASGLIGPGCQVGDFAFDSDVYSYRAWIVQRAGADLYSTGCGGIPQLGEAGAASMPFSGELSTLNPTETHAVEIPPGTAEVRFSLNGEDYSPNSSDPNSFGLLIDSAPPATQEFPCAEPSGPYAYCAFRNPDPGTWQVTARWEVGAGTYQLTVTTLAEPAPTATFTPVPRTTATTRPTAATATPALCFGDCNDDGVVTIAEIILGVNIALGAADATACGAFDPDGTGIVTIDRLIQAINSLLNGCRRAPTRSPSATVTQATAAPTVSPAPSSAWTATATPEIAPSQTVSGRARQRLYLRRRT